MSTRTAIAIAIVARDPAFGPVVGAVGAPPARRAARVDERFAALVASVTYQLLATAAARTIHARVVNACGGVVTADTVLAAGHDELRAAGLSRTKAAAMVDLALRAREGTIDLRTHGRRSDADIVAELTRVRGVGPWTAQMYLMHTLGRRDVWPVGDYGVRYGWSLLHARPEIIDERDLRNCGERFVGLRSDVAWYCWQAVHLHRSSQ